MQCASPSSASLWVSRSVFLPLLRASINTLCALRALKDYLVLFLRKHTPLGSKPGSSASWIPLSAIPVHPSAYAGTQDDFDPTEDPSDHWSDYLDTPEVIFYGRKHVEKCFALDAARDKRS